MGHILLNEASTLCSGPVQDLERQGGGKYQHQKYRGGIKTAEVGDEPLQKEMKGVEGR